MNNPQLDADGRLRHLLSIEGLPKRILNQILDTAESFVGVAEREVKKVPLLRGKTVCNLFLKTAPAPAPPLKSQLNVFQPMSSA